MVRGGGGILGCGGGGVQMAGAGNEARRSGCKLLYGIEVEINVRGQSLPPVCQHKLRHRVVKEHGPVCLRGRGTGSRGLPCPSRRVDDVRPSKK